MRRQISETQMLWAIIGVMIIVDAIWAWSSGIKVELHAAMLLAFCLIVSLNLLYTTIRPNPVIAAFAAATSQLIAFTAAGAILSYLAASSKFPLIDRYLAGADAAIGFDWLSLFRWVQEHPGVDRVLAVSYGSGIPQIGVLLVVLPVLGQFERMREFVWLFVLTLLIIIPFSWLVPAEGAWAYYGVAHLTNAYYLPHFNALRAGAMPEIAMAQVVGIIQFPSFHAALALILIYVSRGISYLFPISFLLNLAMIASTPTSGGHHFTDILAGLAVVPLAIFILRSWQREPSARLAVALNSVNQNARLR